MKGVVCLYFGQEGECPNCGGWVFAQPPPNNIVGIHGLHFCSEDCASEYEERGRELDARRPYFCEICGTDDPTEHWSHERAG